MYQHVTEEDVASGRYPYTYAADFVRSLVMQDEEDDPSLTVSKLSRANAAGIWHTLARIWGLDEVQCGKLLADHYLSLQKE